MKSSNPFPLPRVTARIHLSDSGLHALKYTFTGCFMALPKRKRDVEDIYEYFISSRCLLTARNFYLYLQCHK